MSLAADELDETSPPAPRTSRPIAVADWRPIGVHDLEPAAWDALRSTGNVAVVAGPGAGKTEFLAQRAGYLLQTGICPWPQRILAISFKRDAAANLGRRVTARVPEHAHRFVSMTFDAFTKGLVDRFAAALPPDWRKSEGYDIRLVFEAEARRFLTEIAPSAPAALRWQVAALQPERFMADVVGGWDLPTTVPTDDPVDAATYAVRAWWRARYLRPGKAYVDFVMLNRLAELLVRAVPKLRRALRLTYPFVFVDEFQDTTSAQFSFLTSVFGDGPAVTAVGDSKQRIMGWAGALPKAVRRFTEAFHATSYPLAWNFRSSDALVQLQHVIASKLDAHTVPAISRATAEAGHDPAALWTFSSLDREAAFIADWIAQDIAASSRSPADFALLARQKIADFEPRFRDRLAAHGIRVRNDDAMVGKMRLQDLLKNETARLLLGLLRLAHQPRGLAAVWRDVSGTMARVYGAVGDDAAQRHVGENLTEMTTALRAWLKAHPPAVTSADYTVNCLLGLADAAALGRYLKSTTPGEDLETITDAFRARLATATATSADWTDALDGFEAADAIGLLTAHRSKGLEYHTVFFLGLDDQQWWAHHLDPAESTSTFFVGLSRAAQRLIFTTTTPHARTGRIADLFTMLDNAGVPEIDQG
ncbi:ATP-dependent helicase [Verrucosispora sp. WMMA2121]|uniref:UvrD-helicase domain-containing protein n=1 Tax=Verrucosispora sp. WMMA2121 TaxID=3015164 RepID=UPI0022B64015|nr:ATP-dependent helicase [Verrucosispora sp. WMMA2121]MCZ7421925.1 ATP-dependent helicase [Verrucosispora sp. WMMA2121]